MRSASALSFLRFLKELRPFVAERWTVDDAASVLRRRLEQRDAGFLNVVEQAIFGNAESPYLPLLRRAGCELGDIESLVRTDGVERTLQRLYDAGIYVTFEEFKGRRPIVRGDTVVEVTPQDFDNPSRRGSVNSTSGGSTGRSTPVAFDLDSMRSLLPINVVQLAALGILDAPTASWWEDLPSATGLQAALRSIAVGRPLRRWFSVAAQGRGPAVLRNRLPTAMIVRATRMFGGDMPSPEPLPLADALTIARWAEAELTSSDSCVVQTNVSRAVRVALAAREQSIDLTGVTFYGASDPPTEGKAREINACGARHVPNYFISEAGCVGVGCAHPASANDVHFSSDRLAMVTIPRDLPQGSSVQVLHFTSLTPATPKILLNVDSDDYATVHKRSCGCLLGDVGLDTHVRDIFSVSKLTTEGVTLVGSDVVRILEEVLPARFGGSALDYQLAEEEDSDGLTRLSLVISPSIRLDDERDVVTAFLHELGDGQAATYIRGIWTDARALRVRRREPVLSERGKLLPLARVAKWRTKNRAL